MNINTLKDIFAGTRNSLVDYKSNYFSDISKLAPLYFASKTFTEFSSEDSIRNFDRMIEDMISISQIFDNSDYFRIVKHVENFSNRNPSLVSKVILDFNLFPVERKLFDRVELTEYFTVRLMTLVHACRS